MRLPRLILVATLLAALAGTAGAQQGFGLRGAQAPAAWAAASRAQSAEPAPEQPQAANGVAALPTARLDDPSAQCRRSCAQAYYFCQSSEWVDDCPGAWSQCTARCAASARAIGR